MRSGGQFASLAHWAFVRVYSSLRDDLDLHTDLNKFSVPYMRLNQWVVQVSPPLVRKDGPLQMLVTNLDYDEHKGRIAIGRVTSGKISRAETVVVGRPGAPALHCL